MSGALRPELRSAVDELTAADLATLKRLMYRSAAPDARAWLLDVVRQIVQASERADPRSPGLAIEPCCPDCLGPTHCDCPQGEECAC